MIVSIKDLLLIESFDLGNLIEEYRLFFLALLPSVFMMAIIVEYLDRLEPFLLVKRAFISILILTSVTTFYHGSISNSIEVADEMLASQKQGNILLMDMLDGINHWDKIKHDSKRDFYKDKNVLTGSLSFFKYHLFDSFVNDGFTVIVYFISSLCFLILKVVYSLVYYLGYGLIGIPCLLYLFPSMGNVLRGGILSYIWCLIIPHILVFIVSMIGTEINKGYVAGQVIGGSLVGTSLLFILTLFIAFTPLIGTMILTGAGVSSAGGIIASMGANFVMNLPKTAMNSAAIVATGGSLGPKMMMASQAAKGGFKMAKGATGSIANKFNSSGSGAGDGSGGGKQQHDLKDINPSSNGSGVQRSEKQVNQMNQTLSQILTDMDRPIKSNPSKFKSASEVKFSLPVENYQPKSNSRGASEPISKHSSGNNRTQKATNNNLASERSSKSNRPNRGSNASNKFKR